MASIKQIVSSKKMKFKIGLKGRNEIHQLLKEKKLIHELNSSEPDCLPNKIKKINMLLSLFLRIC